MTKETLKKGCRIRYARSLTVLSEAQRCEMKESDGEVEIGTAEKKKRKTENKVGVS